MSTKRFVVFSYDQYYPTGGWNDKRGDFATLHEARECALRAPRFDYYDIVDLDANVVIETEKGQTLK